MKSLSFKKCQMDNQIYISQLSTSLRFYKFLFEVKKIDVRLNKTLKLTFILMLFDSVYPTRPSDTVTKYTIYTPILLVERLLKWSWVLLCYFIATLLYHQLLFGGSYSKNVFGLLLFNMQISRLCH